MKARLAGSKRMGRLLTVFPVVAILLVTLLALLAFLFRGTDGKEKPLRLACAAGLREPMMAVAGLFERETGQAVEITFGGSGELVGQLQITGSDLYFPADEDYLKPLGAEGRLREVFEVVRLRAGLVVPSGNPRGLKKLGDLTTSGLRLSLADRSAAIGKLTWQVLEESVLLEEIRGNVVVSKPTVNGVVEDVALGAADATLAWDSVAARYDEVDWHGLVEFTGSDSVAALAVMASSEREDEALRFARFVVDREKGGRVFAKMGFRLAGEK